jgi:hypothetical protein
MPIARRPSVTTSQGTFVVPGLVTADVVRKGASVAVAAGGIIECGAGSHPGAFIGFAIKATDAAEPLAVISVRGSSVVPIIEGGGIFAVTLPVYLAATVGEVTQTPPPHGPGTVLVQVGVAASATEFVLTTDARIGTPG